MEQPNQEVRLGVAQPVATAVLHEFELGIDALADRGRCRLGKYNPCECLPYIEGTGLVGAWLEGTGLEGAEVGKGGGDMRVRRIGLGKEMGKWGGEGGLGLESRRAACSSGTLPPF